MALRPGRTVRTVKRPYTRVSQKVPKKSYVVGVPFGKIHQFEMGDSKGNFDKLLYLTAERRVQIRDNALEAARIVSNKFLDAKLGPTKYFMKVLIYPHNVIREKPIATGAGADRFSQGMRQSFGKPSGRGAQVHEGQRLVMLRVAREDFEMGKKALKKFSLKISTPARILEVE